MYLLTFYFPWLWNMLTAQHRENGSVTGFIFLIFHSTWLQKRGLEAHSPHLRNHHSPHRLPTDESGWSPLWWHASLLLCDLSFSQWIPSSLFLLFWFLKVSLLEEFLEMYQFFYKNVFWLQELILFCKDMMNNV